MSTKVIPRQKVAKSVAEMAQEAPQLEVAISPKAPQVDSSLAALLAAHVTPPANILNSILIQGQGNGGVFATGPPGHPDG